MDDALDRAFELTERLGLPLVVAAWLTVFCGAVALALVLRPRNLKGCWRPALVVGTLSLTAHLLDFAVTLHITPDLTLEANPIWRLAIARLGLPLAKAYGLTGKLLVSVISFELFAWYLAQRGELFPPSAGSFKDFVQHLGKGAAYAGNIRSFFAWSFALFGPYFFYVTLLNLTGESTLAAVLPGPIVAICVYFLAVTAAYFVVGWRAFLKRSSSPTVTNGCGR